MEKQKIHLFVFNLSTDDKNQVLKFNQDWVRAFSEFVDEITVVSTHVGPNSLPSGINVIEIGGGDLRARLKSLQRLFKIGLQIGGSREKIAVFHHMSPRTAVILGPIMRFKNIPQGLWYSHSKASWELHLASMFVNKIFSTSPNSLPIKSKKAEFVGHGINTKKFSLPLRVNRDQAILSLGRVTKIKNNEKLITEVSKTKRFNKEIHLAGPLDSEKYLFDLIEMGRINGVEVRYVGEVENDKIFDFLNGYSICYTGNPNTVDKSVLEGAMSGCFTIGLQRFVMEQTGMIKVLQKSKMKFYDCLSNQIEVADTLNDKIELRRDLSNWAKEMNNLENTVSRILNGILKR